MFAAAHQITGWSGLVGEAGPVWSLERVTGGLRRARVAAAEVGWGVMT